MSSRRREPCRNFQRGSCQYGDRCKFLHVTQQQSRPNSFEYGPQNTSQFSNTSQQQKPNPFGFGIQNSSGQKTTPNFGAPARPFENKWTRASSTTTTSSTPQASSQQAATHQCTDSDSCKWQIVEDFKNELPLWRLTCYGHWKNQPCDIVGDISYEELRAAAYEDARKGLPVQTIIERERNLYNFKCAEFDNLLKNPYVIRSTSSAANSFPGVKSTSSTGFANNAPAENKAPHLFSSFSQPGASTSLDPNIRPQVPAIASNSCFAQPNLPQPNFSQPSLPLANSQNPTGLQMNSGLFGKQLPSQPSGNPPGPTVTNFQNGVMAAVTRFQSGSAAGGNQVASPLSLSQFPSSQNNGSPSFPNVLGVGPGTVHQPSALENHEDVPDDSVWLKKEWAVGEIPMVAPPAKFSSGLYSW